MQSLPAEIDGALITSDFNRRYYTGFESSAGAVLATREGSYFLTDSRYAEAAGRVVRSCAVILQERLYEQLGELISKHRLKCVAVEDKKTSLRTFREQEQRLRVCLSGDKTLSDAIARQRSVKTPEELEAIGAAQKLADDTFTHILEYIKPGRTEREIALEMEFHSRKSGSEGEAFSFIVVSGENSSLPHGNPSDKAVEAGDFITMDFGCIVDGYRSDMTRTVAVGRVGEEQRRVYDTVLRAQLAALEAVRAGVVCRDVDRTARDIIAAAGYGEYFGHGLGHSLGLEIHEEPRFNTVCETLLEPGMVLSVEPGIYLPGRFGVRIEDIVAVTAEGCGNFARSTKDLLIL